MAAASGNGDQGMFWADVRIIGEAGPASLPSFELETGYGSATVSRIVFYQSAAKTGEPDDMSNMTDVLSRLRGVEEKVSDQGMDIASIKTKLDHIPTTLQTWRIVAICVGLGCSVLIGLFNYFFPAMLTHIVADAVAVAIKTTTP